MKNKSNGVISDTFFLYLLTIAKILFPLITLPYLTRVLSTEYYGAVSYVKSYIIYVQLIVDFGFILSSVKDIVRARGDNEKIGIIAGNTFFSKVLLAIAALFITIIMALCIPILKSFFWYTILSYFVVFLSCFLADFLFRGVGKTQYISIVFVIMKSISTTLTFLLVRGDSDIMWIPVLDIISSVIAITITVFIIRKLLKIRVRISSFKQSLYMIKESFPYFLSNIATTAFGALNTLLIGIYITDLAQVAYWTVCSTIVAAVQSLYTPITNGVYPYMIKTKNIKYINKVLLLIMPIILAGGLVGFFLAKTVLLVIGGHDYVDSYYLLRALIPLMIISFPAMLYGWPTLGSINKIRETTITTILAAVSQVVGLLLLIVIGKFTLINIAILRTITELVLLSTRLFVVYKNKNLFANSQNNI